MNALVISPIARDDLKRINQYGKLNWGAPRAFSYLDQLKVQFWSLIEHPKIGRERNELLPDMRSLAVASHIIFYRLKDQQIEIVRVLHDRQDPQRHIK